MSRMCDMEVTYSMCSYITREKGWLTFSQQTQLKLVVFVNEWVAWCQMFCKMFKNGEDGEQIVPQSREKIQVSSSVPVSLYHYRLLVWEISPCITGDDVKYQQMLKDLFSFPRNGWDCRIRPLRWYWFGSQRWSWPVTLHMEVLAHCGPYEVIRKVNGKQGLSQRSRTETHTQYVYSSIQTHTDTYVRRDTHGCTFIEDNQTHSF